MDHKAQLQAALLLMRQKTPWIQQRGFQKAAMWTYSGCLWKQLYYLKPIVVASSGWLHIGLSYSGNLHHYMKGLILWFLAERVRYWYHIILWIPYLILLNLVEDVSHILQVLWENEIEEDNDALGQHILFEPVGHQKQKPVGVVDFLILGVQ